MTESLYTVMEDDGSGRCSVGSIQKNGGEWYNFKVRGGTNGGKTYLSANDEVNVVLYSQRDRVGPIPCNHMGHSYMGHTHTDCTYHGLAMVSATLSATASAMVSATVSAMVSATLSATASATLSASASAMVSAMVSVMVSATASAMASAMAWGS